MNGYMILWNRTRGAAVSSVTLSDLRMAIVFGASSPSTIWSTVMNEKAIANEIVCDNTSL
ncbi:hypothetical protein D3C84_1280250 [compost metagenome]